MKEKGEDTERGIGKGLIKILFYLNHLFIVLKKKYPRPLMDCVLFTMAQGGKKTCLDTIGAK